jgi:hypothetical protein
MADTGLTNPGTGTTKVLAGSSMNWSGAGNILSSDNVDASVAPGTGAVYSNYLVAKNFGFSIPSGATIDGIIVKIERAVSISYLTTYPYDKIVSLNRADDSVGATNKAVSTQYITGDVIATYGSSSDLWGETLTPSGVNDPDFGVAFSVNSYACFLKGTMVKTPSGEITIETVKSGDILLVYNDNLELVESKVIALLPYKIEKINHLIAGEFNVWVSDTHPFYSGKIYDEKAQEYVPVFKSVGSLRVGDTIYALKDGVIQPFIIDSIESFNGNYDVYDIALESPNTYIANNFAVHNKPQLTVYVDNIQMQVYYTESSTYSGSVTITEE